jgi:hypothetical protein
MCQEFMNFYLFIYFEKEFTMFSCVQGGILGVQLMNPENSGVLQVHHKKKNSWYL